MNYYLDRNQILRIASNADVYNRGVKYHNEGRVGSLTFSALGDLYIVQAQVKGNLKNYSAFASFCGKGILKSYKCSCDANQIWRGACKHIVSLLLKIFEDNQQKVLFSKDIRISKKMLDFFEKQAYVEIDGLLNESSGEAGKISIIPTLNIDDECFPYLTFTIGRERKYILKNIYDFAKNIRNEAVFSYGKNLEFKHKLSIFDKQGAEIISLILKEIDNASAVNVNHGRNYFYHPSHLVNKSLYLSARGFDNFFNLFINRQVSLDVPDMAESVLFTQGVPNIKFDLRESDQPQCILITTDSSKAIGIKGEEHSYILHENCLYMTQNDYYNTVRPIISAFRETSKNSLLISEPEFARFMTFLYPRLKEYNLLLEPAKVYDFVVEYCPLNKKLYFDTNNEGNVTCELFYCYGDDEINSLNDNFPKENRNDLEEYKIAQKLILLGFVADSENSRYVLKGDDLIYDFYYSETGLDMLRENNEIYATDEFLKKSVKPKAGVSFGVRLNGNLLEVDIDSKDYDIKELGDIINSYKIKKKFHRLKNGVFLSLDQNNGNLTATMNLISGLGLSEKELKKGVAYVPKYRALYLENIIASGQNTNIEMDASVDAISSGFKKYKDLNYGIPPSLNGILRPYQKDGFNWLKTISHYNFGGILADDMGLGKTLEIISVLLSEKGNITKPSIVIAPTSLVYNWEKELSKFAPELKAAVIVGTSSKRHEMLANIGGADVLITTYDTLKRDIAIYEKFEFEYVIADEAQNIKNPATQNAKALKEIKGRVKYALTGTPVENSLTELWSIFDFIMPGYLYSHYKFMKHYETPIIKEKDEQRSEELRRQITPFILRRLKRAVLQDLPEKIETTLYADMTDEQSKIYTAYLMKAKGELETRISDGTYNSNKIDILAQLTRLRQICCHPAVFIDNYKGGSGKLDVTMETIDSSLKAGHRILIFSQFTSMLSIIKDNLNTKKIEYFYLDGSLESKQRLIIANRFNEGERNIFLISLKAGGTGLNLTGADVVIHFDPWWNPAVMDQASDRAHRIGQKRAVQVINIVAKDSIEEKILNLQSEKKNLVDNIIREGLSFIDKMPPEEIMLLFKE